MPPLDAILRFAEEPDSELPEPALPLRRIVRPNFTLSLGPVPTQAGVERLRTTESELDATVAEVRVLLREHGYVACLWYVGPSCRPVGSAKLLAERGFVPSTHATNEAHLSVMVLTKPPPSRAPAPGVEARRVESFEEYQSAVQVGLEAAGESQDSIAGWLEAAPALWRHENGVAKQTHVAFADGHVVGFGFAAPGVAAVLLAGSAVLPAYRGRGIYRALITSRWHSAVAGGKGGLAVHAGTMSKPILERCGFEEICRLDVLADTMLI